MLPQLITSFADCGGWVTDRKTLSPTTVELRLEIQLQSVLDLYAAIIAAGVELTHAAHLSLTGLCNSRKYPASFMDPNHLIVLRLEINFLEDLTLNSLLASLAPPA